MRNRDALSCMDMSMLEIMVIRSRSPDTITFQTIPSLSSPFPSLSDRGHQKGLPPRQFSGCKQQFANVPGREDRHWGIQDLRLGSHRIGLLFVHVLRSTKRQLNHIQPLSQPLKKMLRHRLLPKMRRQRASSVKSVLTGKLRHCATVTRIFDTSCRVLSIVIFTTESCRLGRQNLACWRETGREADTESDRSPCHHALIHQIALITHFPRRSRILHILAADGRKRVSVALPSVHISSLCLTMLVSDFKHELSPLHSFLALEQVEARLCVMVL